MNTRRCHNNSTFRCFFLDAEDESRNGLTAQVVGEAEDTLKRWQSITTAITTNGPAHRRKDRDNDREDDYDQMLMVLSCQHEARARIDELEYAVADSVTQSERAKEKLSYVATPTMTGGLGVGGKCRTRFEQELKLDALEKDEANELVKNVCAVFKSVVQQQTACTAEA